MTTPDLTKLERGWALIAEGAETISLAYAAMSQPGRVPSASPASDDDLPPLEEPPTPDELLEGVLAVTGGEVVRPVEPTPDTALGRCPVHLKAWTVKAGGVSKNGRSYRAFWKCSERDADGFCNEKPIPAWANSHPPERAMVTA